MTDKLLEFPSLAEVNFNSIVLSKSGFEKLVAAGIEVDHRGLVDFEPSNYLRYESLVCEVDLERSEIVGEIQSGKPGVEWQIRVQTTDRYCPTPFPPPTFESPPFSRTGDWRELVG